MSTVAEIEALLKARDEMSRVLKKAQENTSTETGKIAGHYEKMQSRAKKAGDKMVGIGKGMTLGVTAPIIAGAVSAVTALGEIEKLSAQTDAAIASTGGAANVSRDQIESYADKLEKLTSVEAESIQEGQNMLLTFTKVANGVGKGNDIFDQGTKAALDMSVALGTDMKSSSMLVGKALNDPIKGLTALSRSGIQFTEDQKKMITEMVAAGDTMGAQKIILGELTTQFGGSGEALGNTMVGKIEKAKNAFGEMTETLATALIPVIEKMTGWIQKAADWFNNLSPAGQKTVGILIAVAAAVGPVLIIMGKLVGAFGTVMKAFKALQLLMMANPWVLLIAAVVALVVLIVRNWDTILAFLKKAWDWIKTTAASVGKWLKDKFKQAVDFLYNLFLNFTPLGLLIKHFDTIKDKVLEVKDWIVDRFNDVVGFFQGLPGRIGSAVSGMWDGIKEAFRSAVNWIINKWNDLEISIGGGSILGVDIPKITVRTPNIPTFHEGGIVPGRPGEDILIRAQAGEKITPADQSDVRGGPLIGAVHIHGNADPFAIGDAIAWKIRTAGI